MKAGPLLKKNIEALLGVHQKTKKDLAVWCKKSESWISKTLREDRRAFQIPELDRIAEFFGLAAYELFIPGIARQTDRRIKERRSSGERRVANIRERMAAAATTTAAIAPEEKRGAPDEIAARHDQISELQRLADEFARQVTAIVARDPSSPPPKPRAKAPDASGPQPEALPRRRVSSRRDSYQVDPVVERD